MVKVVGMSVFDRRLRVIYFVESWRLEKKKKGMYTANPVVENSETLKLFPKAVASVLPWQSVKIHCKSEGLSIIEG